MSLSLEEVLRRFIAEFLNESNETYIGCGPAGLIAFYKAIGVRAPCLDDLSSNLMGAYQEHVTKNLNKAWAAVCLSDLKDFLDDLHRHGFIEYEVVKAIKPNMSDLGLNDFAAYSSKNLES